MDLKQGVRKQQKCVPALCTMDSHLHLDLIFNILTKTENEIPKKLRKWIEQKCKCFSHAGVKPTDLIISQTHMHPHTSPPNQIFTNKYGCSPPTSTHNTTNVHVQSCTCLNRKTMGPFSVHNVLWIIYRCTHTSSKHTETGQWDNNWEVSFERN